jgi:hypothetical protein
MNTVKKQNVNRKDKDVENYDKARMM